MWIIDAIIGIGIIATAQWSHYINYKNKDHKTAQYDKPCPAPWWTRRWNIQSSVNLNADCFIWMQWKWLKFHLPRPSREDFRWRSPFILIFISINTDWWLSAQQWSAATCCIMKETKKNIYRTQIVSDLMQGCQQRPQKYKLPWKYGAVESILMEWSFGVSWIDDLFILDDDDPLILFLTEILSPAELGLELDACNWFDFGVSENVAFGF